MGMDCRSERVRVTSRQAENHGDAAVVDSEPCLRRHDTSPHRADQDGRALHGGRMLSVTVEGYKTSHPFGQRPRFPRKVESMSRSTASRTRRLARLDAYRGCKETPHSLQEPLKRQAFPLIKLRNLALSPPSELKDDLDDTWQAQLIRADGSVWMKDPRDADKRCNGGAEAQETDVLAVCSVSMDTDMEHIGKGPALRFSPASGPECIGRVEFAPSSLDPAKSCTYKRVPGVHTDHDPAERLFSISLGQTSRATSPWPAASFSRSKRRAPLSPRPAPPSPGPWLWQPYPAQGQQRRPLERGALEG